MRRRARRTQFVNPELDITAFMNLMVILVPFLLITAVFSRVTILDLYLPPAADTSAPVKQKFQLEITIRQSSIEVRERLSRFKEIFPKKDTSYDYAALTQVLLSIKNDSPGNRDATILLEPDVEYDVLVQVMDRTRLNKSNDINIASQELFPEISVGDAPPLKRGKKS